MVGDVDHNQCFLESSLALEVLLLAADGFHPALAHPHGQQQEILLGDQPGHVLGSRESYRGTASFWAALGGSPWWALFLIRCICDPVVFVHVKHPPASWVQTKEHSPLAMPACVGGLVQTWWTLSVPSSSVLWIQRVCHLQCPSVLGKPPQTCPPCPLFHLLFSGSYFSTNIHRYL